MYRNLFYNYTDEEILLYTWDKEGNRVTERHTFHPYYYVDTSNEPDAYSIFGGPLKKREFRKQFDRLKSIKDGGATKIYHNIVTEQQFLIDHFGHINNTPDFNRFPLRLFLLDIEVYSKGGFPTPKEAKDKINLFTIYDSTTKHFYTWGLEKEYTPERADVTYYLCKTESELLEGVLKYWESNYPDVVSGWNSEFFDIPYIINRIKRVLGDKQAERLSPVNRIFEKQFMGPFGKPTTKWVIYGLSCLDYMELYKKFTMEKRESYKLDAITEVEIGKNKIKYKYGNLATLADQDWPEFVKYNIIDVDLLVQLDIKLCYIELTRKLAYTGLTSMEAALGTLSVVTGCIAIKAKEMGQVIPTFEDDFEGDIEGGYVREPIRGLHDAIVSFDANSLYPNTMITLNLSPETKLGKIVEKTDTEVRILGVSGKEYTVTLDKFAKFVQNEQVAISRANVMFTQKKKGIVPQIIEKLYNERVDIKAELKKVKKAQAELKKDDPQYGVLKVKIDQLNVGQHTIKILINSMYGYWANKFSPLGDPDLARSITLTGQAVAKQAAKISEDFVKVVHGIPTNDHIVIAGDTDSIYLSLNPLVKGKGIKVCTDGKVTPEMYKLTEELEKYLNEEITKWANKALNAKDSRFVFKRETICDTALFIEKKRYVAHVLDDEGLPVDKFKYVGVSVVTTSVPKKIKPFIKNVAETMLRTKSLNETNKVYAQMYEKYKEFQVEDIATTRGITDYDSYAIDCNGFQVGKGTPVHVKSAYYYNTLLDQFNIADKYEKIGNGDKIKWFYTMPNRYKIESMAYKDYLPEEIKQVFQIDIETMFEKTIGSAVNILYTAANWPISSPNNQHSVNLLDLFVE